MKILYWCVRFLMNQSLDFNNENWKCVKLKCPEMKITMIPHTWWWAVISHRSVCPACLWLSNDWDSLIEVVLGTSRKEFNLSANHHNAWPWVKAHFHPCHQKGWVGLVSWGLLCSQASGRRETCEWLCWLILNNIIYCLAIFSKIWSFFTTREE